MRILTIAPLIPYPLVDGGRKGIYYPMRYLAERGHEVHLCCLSETLDPTQLHEMRDFCTIDVVQRSKKRTLSGLVKSMGDPVPYLLSRFHDQRLLEIADRQVQSGCDLVYIDGLHCAYYGQELRKKYRIPMVLKLHNAESLIVERFRKIQKNPILRMYATIELQKLRAYETMVLPRFDHVLFVSSKDEANMRQHCTGFTSTVISAGVDPAYFAAQSEPDEPDSILWIGTLDWPPNQDSFWWFFNSILPKLVEKNPKIVVYVVGNNPPRSILAIQHPNIRIVGYVEDVRAYLQRCRVCVVPLRIGGGVRLKLLEMFSMKKAVVSTSVGCEGLGLEDGRELSIRDQELSFADTVLELLEQPELRARLGETAYQYVLSKFTWEKIAEHYDTVLRALVNQQEQTAA